MATPAVSVTVGTICGEPLNGKRDCLACLVRGGLDEPGEESAPALSSLGFGDFEIERREDGSFWELGHGAMGITYRALDKVLHRRIALKVIDVPAEAGGAHAARERFLREARAAAALRHPNAAGVFQFGASPEVDRCYYAMELVEGETLEALVRRDGPLKVELALEIALQVTRALIAAEIRSSQTSVALPVEQLVTRKVPAPVIKLLRRTLATDPAERPQSARALLSELELCRAAMEAAPRRRRRLLRVALGLGLLAICAGGLTSYLLHRHPAAPALPPEKSIAVLPFENLSKDRENAFFAAGIQDDVLTSLAQIHELKVISRTSVMTYKPGARNMHEIGQALNVANVLEGSVRRAGDRVVVNVHLVDTRTDQQLWANHYDNRLADSLGLQGELAKQIALALEAKLASEEKARLETKPTANPEAYVLYLKALAREAGVNQSAEDITAATQLYAQAIALDPKFALAYARLSIVESYLALKLSKTRALRAEARAAAEEALRLSPSLGGSPYGAWTLLVF